MFCNIVSKSPHILTLFWILNGWQNICLFMYAVKMQNVLKMNQTNMFMASEFKVKNKIFYSFHDTTIVH